MTERARVLRWRLVLGEGAEAALGCKPQGEAAAQDEALAFLYDREYGAGRNVRQAGGSRSGDASERGASLDPSQLAVPDWINQVHELFPQATIERLERDALERYQLDEMVTNPEVLRRAQPSPALLKAVLQTKHLMNQEVLRMARTLVRSVVEDLIRKLAREVQSSFTGAVDRQRRGYLKVAKNFDAPTTLRRNLANYNAEEKRLYLKTAYFYSRVRRNVDRWQLILVVDQSGSMLDSVIHSAVMASIFWGLGTLKTHLVIFDTAVVDLTSHCTDPVETLMKVQLGGGTDIAAAMQYAASMVENPRRTIVVLVTDFYEGGSETQLLHTTKALVESGVNVLGLAALDERAEPNYDRELAARMVGAGAEVAAMTPGELADWVARKVR